MLPGVERRPMVEVVHRGDRPGGVGVPVHGRRHPYSVHPAVVGQLIVLSKNGPEEKKERERGEERERERARERGIKKQTNNNNKSQKRVKHPDRHKQSKTKQEQPQQREKCAK